MYGTSLGDDGAELRPLEPWHAEEFLAHLDRGREFVGRHIAFGTKATDVDSAREHGAALPTGDRTGAAAHLTAGPHRRASARAAG